MFTPIHRYENLHPAAHRFARVPRYGRLLSQLPESLLQSIDTEAKLFWTVYTSIGDNPEQHTGILHDALRRPNNQRFGWHSQTDPSFENTDYIAWQIRLAMDMLGALAFAIMFGDEAPWDHRERPRDSIDHDVNGFRKRYRKRFASSGAYRDLSDQQLDANLLVSDWDILVRMNSQVFKHFVLSRTEEKSLRFNDVTTQAFFAAYWAANYVQAPKERERLWSCIPDDWRDERQAYTEFWVLLADMPDSVFHSFDDVPSGKECWEALLSPIFDQTHPRAPKDGDGQVIRATKLIYHAWDRMKETAAGLKFCGEFAKIREGGQGGEAQGIAQRLLDGFRFEKPLCKGHYSVNDKGEFTMGCSDEHAVSWDTVRGVRDNPEHQVKLSEFWVNVFCVRNSEYELFEPRRASRRAFADEVDGEALLDHPVVEVSWYDAACYAKWLGELDLRSGVKVRIELPTEARWEYVCRAGVEGTAFSWDGKLDDNRIESGSCNFNGNYPWGPGQSPQGKTEGAQYLGRTIPVDGQLPGGEVVAKNRWGFGQLHGNVWEWCRDWYGAQTYHARLKNMAVDPEGPRWATGRVLRGGGWISFGAYCRAAYRVRDTPGDRDRCIGFRLAAVPVSRAGK